MQFKQYRKTTCTVARQLTHADFVARNGVIQTLEGERSFEVGDYLAKDAKGEWPITRAKMERDYRRVSNPDASGFAEYQPLDVREAAQSDEPFTINGLTGKAGDYHVRSGGNEWIVDREIFENGYEEVKP